MFLRLRTPALFHGVVVSAAVVALLLGPVFASVVIGGGVFAQDSGEKKAGKSKSGGDKSSSDKSKKGTDEKKGTEEKPKKPAEPPEGGAEPTGGSDGTPEPRSTTEGEGGKKSDGNTSAQPLSIDDEYVRENLEAHLHPTTIQWLPDGRVKMSFDFTQKNEDHEAIFSPKLSKEINAKFRWSVRGEYGWGWGYSGSSSKNDTDYWYGGLRMGMDGQALINCWFTDDVEVESSYAQFVSHSAKQAFAVVFTNDAGKSLGANFGTQTAMFNKGRLEKAKGTVDQVLNEHGMKFKLLVKDGSFEAFRDGKSKQKQEYAKKSYASGKVGFIWGGGIASVVHRLDITGRIDSKKMAGVLRKAGKK